MASREIVFWQIAAVICLTGVRQCTGQESDFVTGLFTVEQPGSGSCFTFDPADHGLDDDRVRLTRCREDNNIGDDNTQSFKVHAVVDTGRFSLATPSDQKCFYGDSQNEFRRSARLCDKSLNYFVTERVGTAGLGGLTRTGSDILIKQWPSDLCVTSNLDGSVNLAPCDPANPRQKWKVCRSEPEDSEVCLRQLER